MYIFKCATNLQLTQYITNIFLVPETQCMKFYHPQRRSGELLRLCRNDECICAEGKQHDGDDLIHLVYI